MHAPTIDLRRWETHLRTLAHSRLTTGLAAAPAAFLRWVDEDSPPFTPADARFDEALWWSVLDPSVSPLALIETAAYGPLFDQGTSKTIEVWTERELSGLHALSRAATLRDDDAIRQRLDAAARWHIERTQPDNATNRPWAAHVFLLIAREHNDPHARLYAETLVHNCQTTHGVPDALSGLILLDSALALQDAPD